MDRGKLITVLVLLAVLGGMTALTSYAVPLYQIFCRVTGYGGTTQVGTGPADKVLDRKITVRFNADVNGTLPWRFEPEQRAITVRVGEPALAFFRAQSLADRTIVGQAAFNVTPSKAGQYFTKVACFCFTQQRLEPGRETELPVQFHIDPAIADDPNLDDVSTITLSYTFFEIEDPDAAGDARAAAPASATGAPAGPALN